MQSNDTFVANNSVEATKNQKVSHVLEVISRWVVYALTLLIPLFYLPFTADGLELPKQSLLIVLTLIGVVAWLGRMLIERQVTLRATTINLLVGIYLVIYAASAWFSQSRYASLVGDFGQQKAGLVTVVCFGLIFFIATNVLRSAKEVRNVLAFAIIGGFVAITQALLQALGLRVLPGVAASVGEFNLVGTSNALGIYVAAILVAVMGLFLTPIEGRWGFVKHWVLGILAVLAAFYVAVLQFWVIWAVVIVGSVALVAYGLLKADKIKRVTLLSLPMAIIVVGLVFSFVRFPISFGASTEVMPSFRAGWTIARESLVSAPLLGSGPGTFVNDYAQFRSKDLNATDFWNVHFDRSSSRALTLLATTGILGIAGFAVLFLFLGLMVGLKLARSHEDSWLTGLAVFSIWLAFGFGKVVYSSNLTLEFMFWLMSALLVVLFWPKIREYRFESSPRASLTLTFFFIIAVILSISGLYLVGQRYAGEIEFTRGLSRGLNRIEDVDASITNLVRATQLNSNNDQYFRFLSQAVSLRANLEQQKASAGKLSNEDAQKILLMYADAVNLSKAATNLNPKSAENWAALSKLYRDLIGSTPGASEAAVEAYEKAIALEPNNPIYYTDLGNVYLANAEVARAGTQSKDEEVKAKAQKDVNDNLNKARENFEKALSAKSDYSPAGYWLAMTFSSLGQTKDAITKLEAVLTQNPKDLTVAFQLGLLYYQDGQKDNAVSLMESVTKINPQYANAQWYLAAMYEDAGRIDDAIARVEEVLKNNADNEAVKQRLTDLQAKKSGTSTTTKEGTLPAPVGP